MSPITILLRLGCYKLCFVVVFCFLTSEQEVKTGGCWNFKMRAMKPTFTPHTHTLSLSLSLFRNVIELYIAIVIVVLLSESRVSRILIVVGVQCVTRDKTKTTTTTTGSMNDKDFLQLCRDVPKAELHIHIGGSFPLKVVEQLAVDPQHVKDIVEFRSRITNRMNYPDVFPIFGLIAKVVNTEEKLRVATAALVKQLYNDGVRYVELRTSIKQGYARNEEELRSGNKTGTFESFFETVQCGINDAVVELRKGYCEGAASKASPFVYEVRLLLSLWRWSPKEMVEATAALAMEYSPASKRASYPVVGIDLSGDSTKGDVRDVVLPALKELREAYGMGITVHLGEAPGEKWNMELLREVQPQRIGHGVHLDEDVAAVIMENKLCMEMCPSTAHTLCYVGHLRDHPAVHFHLGRGGFVDQRNTKTVTAAAAGGAQSEAPEAEQQPKTTKANNEVMGNEVEEKKREPLTGTSSAICPLTINTDDPLLFSRWPSDELYFAFKELSNELCGIEHFKTVVKNSFSCAFVDEETRSGLLAIVDDFFAKRGG